MATTCHPFPADAAQSYFAVAVRALCDRPGETKGQAEARTREMVHMSLGLEPRDGLEYMLSTLVYGQIGLILDAMREVFQAEPGIAMLRRQSGVVALHRVLLSTLRELRLLGRRSIAETGAAAEAPAKAKPRDAGPTAPSDAAPSDAAPSDAVPSDAVPSVTATSKTSVAQSPPAVRQPPASATNPAKAAPAPTPPRAPVLTLADFPPGEGADDDARVAANLASFQKAHAEALKTLAETVPRARVRA